MRSQQEGSAPREAELARLYLQHFRPFAPEEDARPFRQVGLYDDTAEVLMSDSTSPAFQATKDSDAELE